MFYDYPQPLSHFALTPISKSCGTDPTTSVTTAKTSTVMSTTREKPVHNVEVVPETEIYGMSVDEYLTDDKTFVKV